ncbi:MAG: cytochrome b/b6 domain-containing protein [Chitinophagales bacterium]
MPEIVHKHPLATRWFHWVNFPVLAIMIWSGLLIYWANHIYKIQIGEVELFHFFPKPFFNALHIPHRLAEGMAWHFALIWIFTFNGLAYVLFTMFSGQWRYLFPRKSSWKESWAVVLYELRIRKSQPAFSKYNAAQRIVYTAIMIMGMGSVVSGFAIYKPVQFSWMCFMCGGYENARLIHFGLTIGYVLFFVVHVVQVMIAGWNNFRSMVTGYSINEKNEGNGRS